MFAFIVSRYKAWKRYETVRRELSQLTDRELADIGISRSRFLGTGSAIKQGNQQCTGFLAHCLNVPKGPFGFGEWDWPLRVTAPGVSPR
jgi:hypothetical protein